MQFVKLKQISWVLDRTTAIILQAVLKTNAKTLQLCSVAFGPLLLYPQKLVRLKCRAKTWLQSHCSNSRDEAAAL